jgi:hypothetical protein
VQQAAGISASTTPQGAARLRREEPGNVVPDLKLNSDRDRRAQAAAGRAGQDQAGGRSPGNLGGTSGRVLGPARAAVSAVSPKALWRNHRLFTILVLLSLLPRILATRAFRPALLTADSFLYMKDAVNSTLGVIRPSGYSFFLRVLEPFHSLLLVTTIQHLMGIGIAVIVYGLLRYHGLPGWGAALAAAPTLFDSRQIALESYILPDTLYCLVIMLAVAILLTKRTPRPWQCAAAGLLLAYASVLRGNGLPIAIVALAFMLVRRVGWRALAAAAAATAIPLIGYAAAYDHSYGQFNITSSDGIFLWSRTTSFANCAIIKPPPQLLPLCPSREKSAQVPPAAAWSVSSLLAAPTPADYLWAADVWWRHDAHPGINSYNDKLGRQFAIDAIKAQPLDYLRVSGRDIALVFLSTDRPITHSTMSFTTAPHIAVLPSYYTRDLSAYAHTTQNTHPVQPYAYFLFLYQLPVYFPGFVFFLVVLAGLAGVVGNWRRWGGLQALPWTIAAISIVLPALLTQSLYRYTIVAIPLACLAAGMAFVRRAPEQALATAGPTARAGQGSGEQSTTPGPPPPPTATLAADSPATALPAGSPASTFPAGSTSPGDAPAADPAGSPIPSASGSAEPGVNSPGTSFPAASPGTSPRPDGTGTEA